MRSTHEPDDAALRRQTFIRTLKLISAGIGQCPSCGREAERFILFKRYQAALPGLLESRVLTTARRPEPAPGWVRSCEQRLAPGPTAVPRLPEDRTGGTVMAGKMDQAKVWLESQLSDGQEHRAERLVIEGMMAGYSERTLRRTAEGLHVR